MLGSVLTKPEALDFIFAFYFNIPCIMALIVFWSAAGIVRSRKNGKCSCGCENCDGCGIFFRNANVKHAGNLEGGLRALFIFAGIILIIAGIGLWIYAVPISEIDDGILNNRLVTGGAYAIVRSPIYSAIMIACTGVLLSAHNLWFLILPS